MSFVATAIIGAGALGAGASIYSANKAAQAQSSAIQQAGQYTLQGQQQAIGAIKGLVGPYAQFGQQLQPTLQSLLTPGPSQTQTLSQLPGFQFARDLAGYGVSAGAGRTGISGSTAVEGGNLESALASQYFSQYVNPLVQLYGQGSGAAQAGASGLSGVATGTAGSLSQLAVGQGNVQAGLYGAIGGAGSNFAGTLANAALISKLTGGGAWSANPANPLATNNPVPPIQYAGGPFQQAG